MPRNSACSRINLCIIYFFLLPRKRLHPFLIYPIFLFVNLIKKQG